LTVALAAVVKKPSNVCSPSTGFFLVPRVPCHRHQIPAKASDKLRRCARCTACGRKGATLRGASWAGASIGWRPFPVEQMTST